MGGAPTAVERIKAESRGLRGSLADSLTDGHTGGLREDDQQLIKLHGIYQQDDRDVRDERRRQKLEAAHSFMIRVRLPGGVATPAQWLALDGLARSHGNGTLKLTTRQTWELNGVLKEGLKPSLKAMQQVLLDSIAACGDVNRNVICTSLPEASAAHAEVYRWSVALSEHLLPKTRAYHEIFLDEERVDGPVEEPLYGPVYLPRKFKTAIAIAPLNDVDVLAHDLGFIAIVDPRTGALEGFNLTVGGGMGASHGELATFPRLADVVGFLTPGQLLAVAEAVLTIQRDFGDRSNRKHARLKYTIADRGIDWFTSELTQRLGDALAPVRPYSFHRQGDRFGWTAGHDGRWHLGLRIEGGRVRGTPLDGLRAIAQIHNGELRITANQNVIVSGISADQRPAIEALLVLYGLDVALAGAPLRRDALACVALPYCPLAMAEAERFLPEFSARVQALLDRHGLSEQPVSLRITGCPNGCARPYLAEIGLIGKAPGLYNLLLGGDRTGTRLNALYREAQSADAIIALLDPLFARFAGERLHLDEGFGDFVRRLGLVSGHSPHPTPVSVKEGLLP